MIKLILYLFIFIFILAPICTFIHEFGHALIPLYKGLKVSINIGEGFSIQQIIGNLSIKIGLLKPWIGYADWGMLKKDELISLILGPVFSLILAGVFLSLGIYKRSKSYSALLFACAGWCIFQFIFTIFPLTYPGFLGYEVGMMSDGAKVLNMIK